MNDMTEPHHFTPSADIDSDPSETQEWRDALLSLATNEGPVRVRHILDELVRFARTQGIGWQPELNTPYINTIGVDAQPTFPGDLAVEERLASLMRWNALAMVLQSHAHASFSAAVNGSLSG